MYNSVWELRFLKRKIYWYISNTLTHMKSHILVLLTNSVGLEILPINSQVLLIIMVSKEIIISLKQPYKIALNNLQIDSSLT